MIHALKRLLFGSATPGFTRRLESGAFIKVANKMEWLIFTDIFVEGDYDLPIRSALSGGHVNIADLGSNVGFFTLRILDLAFAAKFSGTVKIACVDGSADLCAEALSRISQSVVPASFNINITSGLIGAKEGHGVLHEFADHGLNSTLRVSGRSRTVDFVNLDNTLHQLDTIHLLKCDIEGSELEFIRNYTALLQKVMAAVFEIHMDFVDTETCIKAMQDCGFIHHAILKQYPGTVIVHFHR